MSRSSSASRPSALLLACEEGDIERVKRLAAFQDINAKNECGYSALALAVKAGNEELVDILLNLDADVNSTNNAGQSILFLASWHNRLRIVRKLLASGARVNETDQRGWTPLIIAVYHNHDRMVSMLIDAGADTEHRDTFSKSAFDRVKSVKVAGILQKAELAKRVAETKIRASQSVMHRSNSEPRVPKTDLDESSRAFKRKPRASSPKSDAALKDKNPADHTKQLVTDSVAEAEASLFKETQQLLAKASKTAYEGLRHKMMAFTEYRCAKTGLKVNARKETISNIDFKVPRTRASRQPSPASRSGSLSQESWKEDDLELHGALNRYSGQVSETLIKGLTNSQTAFIKQEVDGRFKRVIEVLKAEIQEMVAEVGSLMQARLEKDVEARIMEIVNDNEAVQERKKQALARNKLSKTMKPLSQKEKHLLSLDLTKLKQVSFEDSELKPEDLDESSGIQPVKVKPLGKSLQTKYTKRAEDVSRRSKVSRHLMEFL